MIEFVNIPVVLDKKRIKTWLIYSAKVYNATIDKLLYSFVTREHLLSLNQKYLNHNTDTDILTFSYGEVPKIKSEIFISVETANDNAQKYSQSIENELIRLISHGFLHSIGLLDKTPDEKKNMTQEEENMINMFHVKH